MGKTMTEELNQKYEALKKYFENLGSVAIAFSSGVDSTLMLKVAHDVLGEKAVAITARSHSFPAREQNEATDFCKKEGIEHIFVDSDFHKLHSLSGLFTPSSATACKPGR